MTPGLSLNLKSSHSKFPAQRQLGAQLRHSDFKYKDRMVPLAGLEIILIRSNA